MPVIDMKGVWSAARNTQDEVHEVNRPGYQGAPRAPVAVAASAPRTRTARASTEAKATEQK